MQMDTVFLFSFDLCVLLAVGSHCSSGRFIQRPKSSISISSLLSLGHTCWLCYFYNLLIYFLHWLEELTLLLCLISSLLQLLVIIVFWNIIFWQESTQSLYKRVIMQGGYHPSIHSRFSKHLPSPFNNFIPSSYLWLRSQGIEEKKE